MGGMSNNTPGWTPTLPVGVVDATCPLCFFDIGPDSIVHEVTDETECYNPGWESK